MLAGAVMVVAALGTRPSLQEEPEAARPCASCSRLTTSDDTKVLTWGKAIKRFIHVREIQSTCHPPQITLHQIKRNVHDVDASAGQDLRDLRYEQPQLRSCLPDRLSFVDIQLNNRIKFVYPNPIVEDALQRGAFTWKPECFLQDLHLPDLDIAKSHGTTASSIWRSQLTKAGLGSCYSHSVSASVRAADFVRFPAAAKARISSPGHSHASFHFTTAFTFKAATSVTTLLLMAPTEQDISPHRVPENGGGVVPASRPLDLKVLSEVRNRECHRSSFDTVDETLFDQAVTHGRETARPLLQEACDLSCKHAF